MLRFPKRYVGGSEGHRTDGCIWDLSSSPGGNQLFQQPAAELVGGREFQVALARLRIGGAARCGLLLGHTTAKI
jgi:hypothetical protein